MNMSYLGNPKWKGLKVLGHLCPIVFIEQGAILGGQHRHNLVCIELR